ncbi:MAG: hypothetical protein ACAH65_00510 [Chloroflexota bacterium]
MDARAVELEPVPVANPAVKAPAWLSRLSAILAVLAIAETLGILALSTADDPRFRLGLDLYSIGFLAFIVLFSVVGALIAWRRPTTRVAWLMILMGVGLATGLLLAGYGATGLSTTTGTVVATRPLAFEAVMFSPLFFLPSFSIGTTLLLLLFPTDHLPHRRWHWVAIAAVAGVALVEVGYLLHPGALNPEVTGAVDNPLAAPEAFRPLVEALAGVGNALVGLGIVLAAVSLVVRYRRADAVVAAQIRWVAVVGALVTASLLLQATGVGGRDWSDALGGLGVIILAFAPIAIGIAVTRYRLYEIDRLINRAVLYGSLTAILAGVFTAGVGLAQRLFVVVSGESSDLAIILTTLVVATLYAPLRKRLEAFVDRRFKYEQRRFGPQLDEIRRVLAVIDPARVAERLASEAVRELAATGAAVVDASGEIVATAGEWPVAPAVEVQIPGPEARPRGESSGRPLRAVLVGPRARGGAHEPAALDELREFARLAVEAIRPGS